MSEGEADFFPGHLTIDNNMYWSRQLTNDFISLSLKGDINISIFLKVNSSKLSLMQYVIETLVYSFEGSVPIYITV